MKKKPTIVISGPPGAGSTTIARALAKKLKLRFFSLGFIQKGLVKGKNESLAALRAWKTRKCKSRAFNQGLEKEQMELAKEGNIVISSKLGVHFIKNADLRVWLDVPLEVREKRAAQRDRIPVQEAKEAISKREETERKEWKRIYGFDYFDQKGEADLVLNSSDLTVSQTVEKILVFLKKKH